MKPSLMYRHNTNSYQSIRKELEDVKKEKRKAGSWIGGMVIIIGLCIIMGADGVDILKPFDLLVSVLFGFGLMAIGGSIVIKANR